eukprot:TRINITY_DN3523_c0_g1_i4.p1 TRINITY_DN3523_c0_g1~~TRINITY_DN3523_c0_g1_i4.p1  ORF type:complete len:250 (-),score=41.20 TRINITY_DN3523_c0_g1_i4:61-810(-)
MSWIEDEEIDEATKDEVEKWKKKFSKSTHKEYCGHKKKVQSCKWNGTGELLATTSMDTIVKIWHPLDRKNDIELKGHTGYVEQCRWNPTNTNELATCSRDKNIKMWDVKTGKLIHTQTTNGENINMDWSPDGSTIAVVLANKNKEDQVSWIDIRQWKSFRTLKFPFVTNAIRWNYNGNFFAVSSGSGSIHILKYPTLENFRELGAHTGSIYCLEMDPLGGLMAAGSADSLVSIWCQRELACIRTINNFE